VSRERWCMANSVKLHFNNFITMAFSQFLSYSIVVYSWRLIAEQNVPRSMFIEFLYCTIQYFVIRRIANSKDSVSTWLGMCVGGCIGTYAGMLLKV
jgi:hypothetical protein